MPWVEWLFAERHTFGRLSIVCLAGVGYLAIRPDGAPLNTVDWVLSVGTLLYGFVAVWSPFWSVTGLAAGIGAGWFFGADNDVVPTVGLAWAMFELGMRRSGRPMWIGLAAGLVGSVVSDLDDAWREPITVFFASAILIVPLLIGVQLRMARELARQASDRAAQVVSRVRAEERATIARELHDIVAHHVASIVLRVSVAADVLPIEDPRVRKVLDDVRTTGSSALTDLRRLVAVLRDVQPADYLVEPAGLVLALESAVDRSRGLGLTVEAAIDPTVTELDSRTALAVLRLTQEGLANVAKHAGTSARAELSIHVRGEQVAFELRDFGGGAAPSGDGGHGLVGLRERVELLGGGLLAAPATPGWRLSALVPAMRAAS
ncbi:histidine kinase [Hamadaea sp. NPDC050747]|uniref:sensor histidine kinase n=1 Tax=Hamadaea sp. NPDC050747 TaxID=3155789 RepID=UPI0033F49935